MTTPRNVSFTVAPRCIRSLLHDFPRLFLYIDDSFRAAVPFINKNDAQLFLIITAI